jgi:hypothetical protein
MNAYPSVISNRMTPFTSSGFESFQNHGSGKPAATSNPFSPANIDFPSIRATRTSQSFESDNDNISDHAGSCRYTSSSLNDGMFNNNYRPRTSTNFGMHSDPSFTPSQFTSSRYMRNMPSTTNSIFDGNDVYRFNRNHNTSSQIPNPIFPPRTSLNYYAGEYFE